MFCIENSLATEKAAPVLRAGRLANFWLVPNNIEAVAVIAGNIHFFGRMSIQICLRTTVQQKHGNTWVKKNTVNIKTPTFHDTGWFLGILLMAYHNP